jgi:hypothetical protein
MAQAVRRGLSPRWPGFAAGLFHVGFLVANVELDRFCPSSSGFPLSVLFHLSSILIYLLGDEQQARWWQQFRDTYTSI